MRGIPGPSLRVGIPPPVPRRRRTHPPPPQEEGNEEAPLLFDHKLDNDAETKRIQAAAAVGGEGGYVSGGRGEISPSVVPVPVPTHVPAPVRFLLRTYHKQTAPTPF